MNSTVNENDDHGIQAEQGGGGTGELRLTNTAANGDDAFDLSGVDLV